MKYLPYIVLGISVITVTGVVFLASNKKKPAPVSLKSGSVPEMTAEHKLISQALNDPDAVITSESTKGAPVEAPLVSSSASTAALPVGRTLSQQAPELNSAALDTDLQNLYLSGASLREDDFVDPGSSKNLSVVRTLINKSRESVE